MANAIPRDGVGNLRTITLAHTSAVEAGEVIVSGGNVLVACNAAEADELTAYIFQGKISFPKGAGVIASSTKVYWDAAGEITTVDTSNTPAGITAEPAADSDAEVLVFLTAN